MGNFLASVHEYDLQYGGLHCTRPTGKGGRSNSQSVTKIGDQNNLKTVPNTHYGVRIHVEPSQGNK